jgi:dienelactone hydrolase
MTTSQRISLESGQIEQIPVLLTLPDSRRPCPLVFYIPGYTGGKESGLSLAYRLARRGVACLRFDPLYHGARYNPRLDQAADPMLGGVYPAETGLDIGVRFFEVIRQSALDVAVILTHLAGDPRLDLTRCGVTGLSMGAYASFLALADLPTLRAAAPMLGLPTFAQRWQDLLDETAWSNPTWAAALAGVTAHTRQHSELIERSDPAARLLQGERRPLLIMSGDFDSDQPKSYVLHWLRMARTAYADFPERLEWRVYPVGHTVTVQMEIEAVEWLVRHLGETDEGPAHGVAVGAPSGPLQMTKNVL